MRAGLEPGIARFQIRCPNHSATLSPKTFFFSTDSKETNCTCSLVPGRAYAFKWSITTISRACCVIIVGHTDITRTLRPRPTRTVKSLITQPIRPYSSKAFTVFSRITQFTSWFRRLVSDIVVCSRSARVLCGKLCAAWAEMSFRARCWSDCATVAVFTWKKMSNAWPFALACCLKCNGRKQWVCGIHGVEVISTTIFLVQHITYYCMLHLCSFIKFNYHLHFEKKLCCDS